jgi:hypothetical protein
MDNTMTINLGTLLLTGIEPSGQELEEEINSSRSGYAGIIKVHRLESTGTAYAGGCP